MLGRLKSLGLRIVNSLWALPLVVALACGGLALLALNLDLPWTSEVAWLYSGTSRNAAAFASSLVGGMISLTTLAISITMVVLTLATQQLGPRLIQLFMSDRGTQIALGLFLGTVIYLLLVLRALDGDETAQAPNLAITGGTILALASVISLLFFVHALASSVVADKVIARVGQSLDRAIDASFPVDPAETFLEPESEGIPVRLDVTGYVQRIDYALLVKSLRKTHGRFVLAYKPVAISSRARSTVLRTALLQMISSALYAALSSSLRAGPTARTPSGQHASWSKLRCGRCPPASTTCLRRSP